MRKNGRQAGVNARTKTESVPVTVIISQTGRILSLQKKIME